MKAKNKKTLLVTLQGPNIGNRLQNYALQTVLEKLGCEIHTPYYYVREKDTFKKRIKWDIKAILGSIGVKKYIYNRNFNMRARKFEKFDSKYISNRFMLMYDEAFKRSWDDYDIAITGSDQVWHKWSDSEYELPYYYLEFIPKDKRISYAPSFGFEEFPESDIELHKKGINEIKSLSCRELNGMQLIDNLTGREAQQVVDPTLLLGRDEWKKLENKSSLYKGKPYLLLYYLGEKTDEYWNVINKIAKDNNLEIIDVFDALSLESMLTTPDEFIWLVDNADYICTDSFHACVFSILFHKKFLAFRRSQAGREGMFNRIETLFELFGIDREYKGKVADIYNDYETIDISEIVNESIEYLAKSVN